MMLGNETISTGGAHGGRQRGRSGGPKRKDYHQWTEDKERGATLLTGNYYGRDPLFSYEGETEDPSKAKGIWQDRRGNVIAGVRKNEALKQEGVVLGKPQTYPLLRVRRQERIDPPANSGGEKSGSLQTPRKGVKKAMRDRHGGETLVTDKGKKEGRGHSKVLQRQSESKPGRCLLEGGKERT